MATEWLLWPTLAVVLYLVVRLLAEPARYAGLLLLRTGVGYGALLLVNLAGQMAGFHLPLNPVTGMVVGVLGLPGLAVVVILQTLYTSSL